MPKRGWRRWLQWILMRWVNAGLWMIRWTLGSHRAYMMTICLQFKWEYLYLKDTGKYIPLFKRLYGDREEEVDE